MNLLPNGALRNEYYKAGEWYRLTLEIAFKRNYGFYIIEIYTTMYINVFLSWIAFCISLKALPARVILSVNTLMSLCLQFGNIISSLPPVSYVKSIDYFMFTCIAYIFGSLVEMAFITYQDKKMLMRSLRFDLGMSALFRWACFDNDASLKDRTDYDFDSTEKSEMETAETHKIPQYMSRNVMRRRKLYYLDRGTRIDNISFIMFPLTFLIFNIVYWTYYLSKDHHLSSTTFVTLSEDHYLGATHLCNTMCIWVTANKDYHLDTAAWVPLTEDRRLATTMNVPY
uniref:Neurotransmitter-gated ion-channel transmembrane domain-containing protein n=1 Tax=Ditylenchus dipsaci TaxID=166011 RepID=A0A915DCH7_9BILA